MAKARAPITWLRCLLRRTPTPRPTLREGYLTFALYGDNIWGNSIAWANRAPEGNEGRVVGWTPRTPRVGDRLCVRMQSGKWGAWVFTKVEKARDVDDMFVADVTGAIAYIDESEIPAIAFTGTGLTGRAADYI